MEERVNLGCDSEVGWQLLLNCQGKELVTGGHAIELELDWQWEKRRDYVRQPHTCIDLRVTMATSC